MTESEDKPKDKTEEKPKTDDEPNDKPEEKASMSDKPEEVGAQKGETNEELAHLENIPEIIVEIPPMKDPPKTYLLHSLFTMIFCFLPVGIFAYRKSRGVREAIKNGNKDLATKQSVITRRLCWAALIIGSGLWMMGIILFIVKKTVGFMINVSVS